MSSLRRTLAWAFLAGCSVAAAGVGVGFAVREAQVVLVPDSLGPLFWPVCVPVDSIGQRTVIRWFPARVR